VRCVSLTGVSCLFVAVSVCLQFPIQRDDARVLGHVHVILKAEFPPTHKVSTTTPVTSLRTAPPQSEFNAAVSSAPVSISASSAITTPTVASSAYTRSEVQGPIVQVSSSRTTIHPLAADHTPSTTVHAAGHDFGQNPPSVCIFCNIYPPVRCTLTPKKCVPRPFVLCCVVLCAWSSPQASGLVPLSSLTTYGPIEDILARANRVKQKIESVTNLDSMMPVPTITSSSHMHAPQPLFPFDRPFLPTGAANSNRTACAEAQPRHQDRLYKVPASRTMLEDPPTASFTAPTPVPLRPEMQSVASSTTKDWPLHQPKHTYIAVDAVAAPVSDSFVSSRNPTKHVTCVSRTSSSSVPTVFTGTDTSVADVLQHTVNPHLTTLHSAFEQTATKAFAVRLNISSVEVHRQAAIGLGSASATASVSGTHTHTAMLKVGCFISPG
jgi:hypothetical protein